MLIIGAQGHAKEVQDILQAKFNSENLFFYEDINYKDGKQLVDKRKILRSDEEVRRFLDSSDDKFFLGLGGPVNRYNLALRFESMGLKLSDVISNEAYKSSVEVVMKSGITLMQGVKIMSGVSLGKGVLLNPNCTVSHDSNLGNFVECGPGVNIAGNVQIGSFTQIGTGVSIIPKVQIGKNCLIGAGSVIINNIPDNSVVVGVPGRIIRKLNAD